MSKEQWFTLALAALQVGAGAVAFAFGESAAGVALLVGAFGTAAVRSLRERKA